MRIELSHCPKEDIYPRCEHCAATVYAGDCPLGVAPRQRSKTVASQGSYSTDISSEDLQELLGVEHHSIHGSLVKAPVEEKPEKLFGQGQQSYTHLPASSEAIGL